MIGAAASFAIKILRSLQAFTVGRLPVIPDNRPALQHAAKYAFFKSGEAGAAARSWSRYVYDFVQGDSTSLNQNDAVRQTYGLGHIMSHEHRSEAAALPDVLDQ
jgi:hypothetical protein